MDTPALLIDADILDANIAAMAALCAGRRQRIRPHAKSHKSPDIARLQIAAGASGLCCAKLSEAEVMAAGGIDDLLITTPVIGAAKAKRLADLATRCRIIAVADGESCIRAYAAAAAAAGTVLDVLVEVDVGQNRCGVPPGPQAGDLADLIATLPSLRFAGLQGYQGRAQGIISRDARRAANRQALQSLRDAAGDVRSRGHVIETLTGGGSGSLPFDLEFDGLDELQPGSYVFMDSSYTGIDWDGAGTPPPFRSALSVLVTVISQTVPDRVIVDAGWKAISCDAGPPMVKGRADLTFEFAGDEHGTIRRADNGAVDLKVGDRLELIPSHCDTTVALHDAYVVVRGGAVAAHWPVAARGRFQ